MDILKYFENYKKEQLKAEKNKNEVVPKIIEDFLAKYNACLGPWDYISKLETPSNVTEHRLYTYADENGELVIRYISGGIEAVGTLGGVFSEYVNGEKGNPEVVMGLTEIYLRYELLIGSADWVLSGNPFDLNIEKLECRDADCITYTLPEVVSDDDAIGVEIFSRMVKIAERFKEGIEKVH